MLSLSSTSASSTPPASDRADAADASRSAVSARSAAKAVELSNEAMGMRATGVQAAIPSMMVGLSTVAVVGAALGSVPAALGRMRDIVVVASSGTLSDADRATLQSEYSQLSHQVSSAVGSASAGQQGSSSADRGDDDASAKNKADAGQSTASGDAAATSKPEAGNASATKPGIVPTDAAPPRLAASRGATGATPAGHAAAAPARAAQVHTKTSRPEAIAQFQQHLSTHKALVSLVA